MKKIKVAINGFGRIGRVFTRAVINDSSIEIVAINDLVDTSTLAHLLKYDSVHGKLLSEINNDESSISIDGKPIKVYSLKDPEKLPWGELGIDVVIESTGIFRSMDGAKKHINAGAKKVIISAPATDSKVKTIVMGINDELIDGSEDILSNASCTTNCAAPMVKIIDDLYTIDNGYITTTHAYTSDQNIHDAPHKDLRRSRAAANSIIPTSTGAAKAIGKIFPNLNGKLEGIGVRVPVINGSMTDIICNVNKTPNLDQLKSAFKDASSGNMKSILEYTEDPIVSTDIIGNTNSCIIDAQLINVSKNTVRVIGWYDNEAGYSNRIVDLVNRIS
jgi:glyceraldehyde 3-phosphate dehydrogenase